MKEFDEESVRPAALEAEARRLFEDDVRRLLLRRHEFVSVDCPACEIGGAVPQFEKSGFEFHECSACGTLFVTPRPTSDQLAQYYGEGACGRFWNRHVFPASASVRKELIFRVRVELVAGAIGRAPVGTLVDVGAGFGWFASMCRQAGLARRVIAVEPNPELAASCREEEGVEVIQAPIERAYEILDADVVTCFELIEHTFDPRAFLDACHRRLRPGGLFVCTTPNWSGFDVALLRERSDNVTGPNHLQLFTPDSLGRALQRAGFREIEMSTPGRLDVDILRNKMLAGIFRPSELPFFGQLICEGSKELRRELQAWLGRHRLSSSLMAVARAARP